MRKVWLVSLLLVAVVAAIALTGCVNSSQSEAETPSNATTVVNSAIQTDSNGKTVSAPASTAPAAPAAGGASTSGGASSGGAAAGATGDVAAGKTFFAATCTACHMQDGMAAGGPGPKLAGLGLSESVIHHQVVNGGAIMPAGLASGKDLDNVVAYVLSIQ